MILLDLMVFVRFPIEKQVSEIFQLDCPQINHKNLLKFLIIVLLVS
jgi:hypothetical protein